MRNSAHHATMRPESSVELLKTLAAIHDIFPRGRALLEWYEPARAWRLTLSNGHGSKYSQLFIPECFEEANWSFTETTAEHYSRVFREHFLAMEQECES